MAERRVSSGTGAIRRFGSRRSQLPGDEVIVRAYGERLIVEPAPKNSLLALLDTLEPIDEAFPPIEDRPPKPVNL
jgi:antitoxin VapB